MAKVFDKRSLIFLFLYVGVLLFTLLYPNTLSVEKAALGYVLSAVFFLLLLVFFLLTVTGKQQQKQTLTDVSLIFILLFFFWEGLTTKWDVLDSFVFPSPEKVLYSLSLDRSEIWQHFFASTKLLITGYGLAFVCAVTLGLFAGWNKRLHDFIKPIASIASPVPPIVYIPYAITLLPSFFLSSVFVVFIGAFWPILLNTLNGVVQIEKRLLESARTLQLSPWTMFTKVLLPGALPGIFTGATIGLVFSFILLTAAELIGASAGLGYYVKYHTDFGDFSRVIVGILLIGVYVTLLMNILQALEKHFLRWKNR